MQSTLKQADNLFLIGLMGAGKSTIGKQLAIRFRKEFIDSDHEIEKKTGVSIETVFDIEGEPGFRRREANMLEALVRREGIVLATGGGAVLAAENRRRLEENGLIIYLQTSVEQLAQRTREDKRRPLLQGEDKFKRLEALLIQREPLYMSLADVVVATDNKPVRHLITEISEAIAER